MIINIKNNFLLILVILFLSCSNFYQIYERVEYGYLKTIDFVYRNSQDTTLTEAMPGDTVLLYAYFTGTEINQIDWDVSFDVYVDLYGNDTVYNRAPLSYEVITPDISAISATTNCEAIKFVIPKDIMMHSPSVDDEILSNLGMSREYVLNIINLLMTKDPNLWSTDPILSEVVNEIGDNLYQILQLFTVPVRLFATVNNSFKIKSDVMVRYNRYFKSLPKINVNKNPKINFIGIHKFKNDPGIGATVSTMGIEDSTYILFINDTVDTQYLGKNCIFDNNITVDDGYFYYISVDSGVVGDKDQRDSCLSMQLNNITGDIVKVTQSQELFYSQWFFMLDSTEMQIAPDDKKWPLISNSTSCFDRFYMSKDTLITGATIWVQLYDDFLGERLRKKGSTIREATVKFKYTDAYKNNLNKNGSK